jgi:hypothetical protein
MKKTYLLLSFVGLLGLVSCGDNAITVEQVPVMKEEEKRPDSKEAVFSYREIYISGDERYEESGEMTFKLFTNYISLSLYSLEGDEEKKYEYYVYLNDDKLYFLSDIDGNKTGEVFTSDLSTNFDYYMRDLSSAIMSSINHMYDDIYSILLSFTSLEDFENTISATMTTGYSVSVASGGLFKNGSDYKLSYKAIVSIKDGAEVGSMKEKIVLGLSDDGLPHSFHYENKVISTEDESYVEYGSSMDGSVDYAEKLEEYNGPFLNLEDYGLEG